jgi:hypothetical protein
MDWVEFAKNWKTPNLRYYPDISEVTEENNERIMISEYMSEVLQLKPKYLVDKT